MEQVRRPDDGELLGFVARDAEGWSARTVFHGELARGASREEAYDVVRARGLASLAERWHWYSRRTGRWEVVVLQEAVPGRVTAAVGYYSLPQSPTVRITADDLAAGDRLSPWSSPPA
ncbi:MAG: hypothetical protein R2737_16030 [Candidatus Nanopelagicales bacterium]